MAISSEQKRQVAERAGYCCEYCLCQLRFSADPLSVEHILPSSRGGSDDLANLALSCQGCNNCKFTATEAFDPVTGVTVPLYDPRKNSWSEHFAWSVDFDILVGLTPVGRATISKLKLNREGVVNLRQVLRVAGAHPPKR